MVQIHHTLHSGPQGIRIGQELFEIRAKSNTYSYILEDQTIKQAGDNMVLIAEERLGIMQVVVP